MARAPADPAFRQWIEDARACPIGDYADAVGIRLRGRVERSGPCPNCGGEDRFNLNTVKGLWFCRQCKDDGGDVIDLVRLVEGCDFVRACEILTGTPAPNGAEGHGLSAEERARVEAERAEKRRQADVTAAKFRDQERRRLHRWWNRAQSARNSLVEDYLDLRSLTLPPGARLRFEPAAKLWADGKRGSAVVHVGPAMFAGITGPDGTFAGLHTTWIDLGEPDGKARVPDADGEFVPAKKVRGSQLGGRIELVRVAEPRRLVIGEGIETTLSVRDDMIDAGLDTAGIAFWAAINLGNLGGPHDGNVAHPTERDRGNKPRRIPGPTPAPGGIPVPDSVEDITILGDGDSDPFLTKHALDRASLRWARPGRRIVGAMAPAGTDFNTLRRQRRGQP